MIRKLLGAPVKLVKKLLGREAPPPPPAPVRRAPPPRPAPAAEGGGGHDHGHSHGGGGHDHGHSHGRAEPEPEPEPAHDHGHGHSHGGAEAAPVGMNIQVDESETPNPNARKFTCSVTVIEKGSASFNTAEEAATHPLGKYIWPIGGVKGIFAVKDFVTVTKTPEADWGVLSRRIPDAIRRGIVERDGQA